MTGHLGPRGERGLVPRERVERPRGVAQQGQAPDRAAGIEHHEVETAVRIDVAHGQRTQPGQARRCVDAREGAGLTVDEDVECAAGVEEGRVGIGVLIEIGPGERTGTGHAWKHRNRVPCTVAAVAQDERVVVPDAQDDVDVAVHLDVGGPGARAVAGDRGVYGGLRRAIHQIAGHILDEQADTAGAGEQQIGAEVVVPVEGHQAVSGRPHGIRTGKRPFSTRVEPARGTGVGRDQDRHGVGVREEWHHDLGRRGVDLDGLEAKRAIRSIGRDRHRGHDQEPLERFGDELGWRAQGEQALLEGGHRRQDVAQQGRSAGGAGQVAGSRGLTQGGLLLGGQRRPAGGERREPIDRVAEMIQVAAFRGESYAFEQRRQVPGLLVGDGIDERLCLLVCARRRRPLDLLRQGKAGTHVIPVECHRAAQRLDALLDPALRRLEPGGKHRHAAALRRQERGALDGSDRPLRVAKPEAREAEIGEGRRLARRQRGRPGEAAVGVREQTDLERRQPDVERTRDLLVAVRPGRGHRVGAPQQHHREEEHERGRDGHDHERPAREAGGGHRY
jgi:hypothetical protein